MTRKPKPPPIVNHLPITKARINLGAVVKQVHLNKEYVVLEKRRKGEGKRQGVGTLDFLQLL